MATFIDTSSKQFFPISSRLLGPRKSTTSSRSRPDPLHSKQLSAVAQLLLSVICFAAAVYVDFSALAFGLELVTPGLPGLCLRVYAVGFVLLLYIRRCESNEEERWRAEKRAAEVMS